MDATNKNLENIVLKRTQSLNEANVELSHAYSQMRGKKDELKEIFFKPEVALLLHADGTILGVTDRVVEASGRSRAKLLDCSLDQVIVDPSGNDISSILRQTIMGNQYRTTLKFLTPNEENGLFRAKFNRISQSRVKTILLQLSELKEQKGLR